MGCLFACFSFSKHRRRRLLVNATPPPSHQRNEAAVFTEKEDLQIPINLHQVSVEKLDVIEGKDTFKTLGEITDDFQLNKFEEEEPKEETPNEGKCSISDFAATNSDKDSAASEEDLVVDNCHGSSKNLILEESSESLFSLSIESRRQVEVESEVTSPMPMDEELGLDPPDESHQCIDSILTPLENLGPRKVVKVKECTPLQEQQQLGIGKENVNLGDEFKTRSKVVGQQKMKGTIALETSLSSWLVESETSIQVSNVSSSNLVGNSLPNRSILGGLAPQELKQPSVVQ